MININNRKRDHKSTEKELSNFLKEGAKWVNMTNKNAQDNISEIYEGFSTTYSQQTPYNGQELNDKNHQYLTS